MKKKIIIAWIFVLCFIWGVALAQTFFTANQSSIEWDAVTTNASGDPIDPAQISYKIYLANANTDPEKANPVEVGTATAPSATITLNTEGKYFVGVSTVRTVGGEVVGESEIAWSDDAASVPAGGEFGVQFYEPPSKPGGIRPQ
jgi:hypothetical protein